MEKDYLTNLPNRRSLYHHYLNLPQDSRVHAMFLDVDNYKKVNDIHGHNMGDQLLVCIANFLQAECDGFIARLGGDEFVVLLDGKMPADMIQCPFPCGLVLCGRITSCQVKQVVDRDTEGLG